MLSTDHEKIAARNSIYAHAQDFAISDELLLVIVKAFISQQEIGFHVFTTTRNL